MFIILYMYIHDYFLYIWFKIVFFKDIYQWFILRNPDSFKPYKVFFSFQYPHPKLLSPSGMLV